MVHDVPPLDLNVGDVGEGIHHEHDGGREDVAALLRLLEVLRDGCFLYLLIPDDAPVPPGGHHPAAQVRVELARPLDEPINSDGAQRQVFIDEATKVLRASEDDLHHLSVLAEPDSFPAVHGA